MDTNNIKFDNAESMIAESQSARIVDAVTFVRETLCNQIVLIAERSKDEDITPSELAQLSEAISRLMERGHYVLRI